MSDDETVSGPATPPLANPTLRMGADGDAVIDPFWAQVGGRPTFDDSCVASTRVFDSIRCSPPCTRRMTGRAPKRA